MPLPGKRLLLCTKLFKVTCEVICYVNPDGVSLHKGMTDEAVSSQCSTRSKEASAVLFIRVWFIMDLNLQSPLLETDISLHRISNGFL